MSDSSTQKRYIQAHVEDVGNKLNFQCWLSTAEFWMEDEDERPYIKNHITVGVLWKIRSNRQLTLKQYEMICEYAAKIMAQQKAQNDKRRIANL